MAETYLAKARESKLFEHVLIDIIDLQGKFRQIDVEMTVHMLSAKTRLVLARDFSFLPKTKEE